MAKKTFDPTQWIQPGDNPPAATTTANNPHTHSTSQTDIETIVTRIESASIDIAPNYPDWRDLGFALSREMGEKGRTLYHRLSRFYPAYTETETDKQYNKCLKAHGHGITIKTLYHLAKNAGVNISVPKPQITQKPKNNPSETEVKKLENPLPALPTIPDEVCTRLPRFLQQITQKSISPEDKGLLLLGSLTAISACLPNIYGIYAERTVYPNLFLFVTAQASAGKGRLSLCRKIVGPIHKNLREQAKAENEEYQYKLAEYVSTKDKTQTEKPKEPPLRMLIIPANNSATGLFQILNDNNGVGLIFETEGDTLAQTFKSEHGNYSDGFRKAFHHETISYNRRKDREYVELPQPRLSALLSGTPKQLTTLIPNAENGLFSRFIFYYMDIQPVWNDVFATNTGQTLDHYFDNLGQQFHTLYKHLLRQPEPARFTLTPPQQQTFNQYFSHAQNQYLCLYGTDYLATVRRLGLITYRLAMILTTLRIMENPCQHSNSFEIMSGAVGCARSETRHITTQLTCSDTDFNTSLQIVKILIQHAAHVYNLLPVDTKPITPPNQKQQFLSLLPPEFSRKDYLNIATQLTIPHKTAEKHIARFVQSGLISHFAHDKYKKV